MIAMKATTVRPLNRLAFFWTANRDGARPSIDPSAGFSGSVGSSSGGGAFRDRHCDPATSRGSCSRRRSQAPQSRSN